MPKLPKSKWNYTRNQFRNIVNPLVKQKEKEEDHIEAEYDKLVIRWYGKRFKGWNENEIMNYVKATKVVLTETEKLEVITMINEASSKTTRFTNRLRRDINTRLLF